MSVADHVVTLDGIVPTLWEKYQIIDFARKLDGIMEVRSTVVIAQAENDTQLAEQVGKAIQGYSRYSVVDYVEGVVRDGVVTLSGAVTAPDKLSALTERVEKIRGVQELKNGIKVLPTSPSDDVIRGTIARQIYADPIFVQYSQANPPIHIVVDARRCNSSALSPRSWSGRRRNQIARSVRGVFEVDNRILTRVGAEEVGTSGPAPLGPTSYFVEGGALASSSSRMPPSDAMHAARLVRQEHELLRRWSRSGRATRDSAARSDTARDCRPRRSPARPPESPAPRPAPRAAAPPPDLRPRGSPPASSLRR